MADNYLENRMSDLKSGRIGMPCRAASSSRRQREGYLQVAFPSRRVLVTGGCHGIGLEIVRYFLKAGCKVAVFDIDSESGEVLAHDDGIRFYKVDVADRLALEVAFLNLLKAWRDIDIVVSNAGISEFHDILTADVDTFDRIIDTNLRPAYILALQWAIHRQAFPSVSDFRGRMIIISSTRHIMSEQGTEGYSASKGALASLTHSLMMSLSRFGITVNSISPGWIHTNEDEVLTQADHNMHPSGRVGVPADIARTCIFLSLPGNEFINGADIVIDGGMTKKMIY